MEDYIAPLQERVLRCALAIVTIKPGSSRNGLQVIVSWCLRHFPQVDIEVLTMKHYMISVRVFGA